MFSRLLIILRITRYIICVTLNSIKSYDYPIYVLFKPPCFSSAE